MGSSPVAVTKTSDIATGSSKEFLDIQASLECGFTLKHVRDMIRCAYSQMRRTDKYSQHTSIIWPVWLNGSVFVYKLSSSGFQSRCSHVRLNSFAGARYFVNIYVCMHGCVHVCMVACL